MKSLRMADKMNALLAKNWPLSLDAVQGSLTDACRMVRGDALMDVAEMLAGAGQPLAATLVLDLVKAEQAVNLALLAKLKAGA